MTIATPGPPHRESKTRPGKARPPWVVSTGAGARREPAGPTLPPKRRGATKENKAAKTKEGGPYGLYQLNILTCCAQSHLDPACCLLAM